MAENWKKKIENFWYYHKGKVAIFCLTIFLLGYGVYLLADEEPEPLLYGEVLNLELSESAKDELCENILKSLGLEDSGERILLETGTEIDVEHPENNAMTGTLENLTVQIFSHELDFMICPEAVMKYYENLGGLEVLENENYGIPLDEEVLGIESSTGEDIFLCILKNSEEKETVWKLAEALRGAES